MRTFLRRHLPWSGIIHLFSAILAAVGAVYLVATTRMASTAQVGAAIYGVSMVFLFMASTASDILTVDRRWALRLQRIDHAAIFVFIAGSYTPLCLLKLAGYTRIALLAAVWVLAMLGVIYKLWVFHAPKSMSTAMYLALGWLAVVAAGPITSSLPWAGIAWLFTGAVLYTVGAFIYATQRCNFVPGVFGHHEVWHLMVSAASASHFVLIGWFVLP